MTTIQALVSRAARATPADLATRAEGALLGLAVGNMLGVPVEFAVKADLERRYPEGLREIDPRLAHEDWDDDLAQAIILAEAARDADALDLDDLAERFVRWRRESGKGIGMLTAQVIEEIEAGTPPSDAARVVWERSDRKSAGNGAVMRCAPVALRWRTDGEALVANALTSALVTHHDPRCTWSTAATVAAIARTLGGNDMSPSDLADAVVASGAPAECAAAIREIDGADIADLSLDDWDQGYTLKAMQVGLWCLGTSGDFEEALVHVVMQGGDTDTNGAVAGAVMGARVGIDGIPQRWLELVPRAEELRALARALVERGEGS